MIIKVPAYVAEELDGLRKKDFLIKSIKGSGPGGQHRNKRETGIRITHKATGVTAEATDSKSQERNRHNAFVKLINKLVLYYTRVQMKEEMPTKRIRSYNEKRGTVKDHRSGVIGKYKDVLDGDLDCFIQGPVAQG